MNNHKLFLKFILILNICFATFGTAGTFIVTNTNDSGPGSLRLAMLDARTNAVPDIIAFNIPITDPGYDASAGVWTIRPISEFPRMWAGGTFIDGASQAAFIGFDANPLGPEIVIDGINAGEASAFYFNSSNNQLRGLVVHRFSYGIVYLTGDSNKVAGCYIGTDANGSQRMVNEHSGLTISGGSHNIIGGLTDAERNVISGNKYNGIALQESSSNNQILGNYIGINSSGTDTLGNDTGIRISSSSNHNIVGPNNVISGNDEDGIIFQIDSDSNLVIGNLIGTDPSGTIAWGNKSDGIFVTDHSSHNTIGGSSPGERNIISSNGGIGITIRMLNSNNNQVIGNYIGTDISGNIPLGNGSHGIMIQSGSKDNIIGGENAGEGNIISGNMGAGVEIYGDGNDENKIVANFIGTNFNETAQIGNQYYGVAVEHNSNNNIIGPDNIIAYNERGGVLVSNGALGNTISRNSIYKNSGLGIENSGGGNNELSPPTINEIDPITGTALSNTSIEIYSGPDDEGKIYEATVTADASGNFNWAGTPTDSWITATATDADGNTSEFSPVYFIGNLIVTTTADSGEGSLRWAIDQANVIPGPDFIVFDIPASDPNFDGTVWTILLLDNLPVLKDSGTVIDGYSQTRNQGNTNIHGPEIVLDGLNNAESYSIGLRVHSAENTVCGLVIVRFEVAGIEIYFNQTHHNHIYGNYIGIDAAGSNAFGNGYGISIGGDANYNVIGGTKLNERNVISGNENYGIAIHSGSNEVIGNFIGTDATGMFACGNNMRGVYLGADAADNKIGGNTSNERNIISGNGDQGISISGFDCKDNVIQGNYIGLNVAGSDTIGNEYGIYISGDAKKNIIGGSEENQGNIVAGNQKDGIYIGVSDSNRIIGNYIGTDLEGTVELGNGYNGINIYYRARANIIGGLEQGEGNIISGNFGFGINIGGDETYNNQVLGNWIGTNMNGNARIPNGWGGVAIGNGPQQNEIGPGNIIRYNKGLGVVVTGITTLYNRITQNSISDNEGVGISLSYGGNRELASPIIESENPVAGMAPPFASVEIFSDSSNQGRIYEATVYADGSGNFGWSGVPAGPFVTATATDDSGNTSEFSSSLDISVEQQPTTEIPAEFSLAQNYPNPFNPVTMIPFVVREKCRVQLKVYDILGKEAATLKNESYQPGQYQVRFRATGLASGIYFYQIQMGEYRAVRKMVLLE